MKNRKKMIWKMKQALDRKGYDPKKCRCVAEDDVAWLFETTEINDDGTEAEVTFWIEKG